MVKNVLSPCRDDEFGDLDVTVSSNLEDHSVSRSALNEVEVVSRLRRAYAREHPCFVRAAKVTINGLPR